MASKNNYVRDRSRFERQNSNLGNNLRYGIGQRQNSSNRAGSN